MGLQLRRVGCKLKELFTSTGAGRRCLLGETQRPSDRYRTRPENDRGSEETRTMGFGQVSHQIRTPRLPVDQVDELAKMCVLALRILADSVYDQSFNLQRQVALVPSTANTSRTPTARYQTLAARLRCPSLRTSTRATWQRHQRRRRQCSAAIPL